MDVFLGFMAKIYELFQIEMNVYGFVFSFWDVFMFTLVAGVLAAFVGGFLREN